MTAGSTPRDASTGRALAPAASRASMRYASGVPGATMEPSERWPFQVQFTSVPLPLVLATGAPRASSTVTVQPAPPRIRARKTIGTSAPVSFVPRPGGVAEASTILGVPVACAAAAMPSSAA